ncbi:GEVED domain-containing protein [Nonomuraea fuscirosea]|uniref:GEVED domain-containing protein n=1 Tax=Nonomuraea fuscirosea TaxID=1291556 RepID=UPI002DD9E637|nr:GEVED domain-containing protein [Nonomuraea fuscirosea]WSA55812.1 GEVED domain-containing protein [Nonomuraea fuscirosea]
MICRTMVACAATTFLSLPGMVTGAHAENTFPDIPATVAETAFPDVPATVAHAESAFPSVPAAITGTQAGNASSSFTNSVTAAVGRTPSGVRVTVTKTMIGKSRVASAKVLRADPAAPDDEYLIPANAKTTAGFVDLYEHFAARPGAWNDVATLTFTFSRPVRDPHLHVFGTGGSSGDAGDHDDYWPAIELTGGTPATPAFARVAGFPGYRTTATAIEPEWTYPTGSTTCGVVYACGTVKVSGIVSSFTVKLRAHDDRQGKGGPTPQLWAAFKLSLAEDDSDAPASYGAASHAITRSSLGRTVTADHTDAVSMTPRALPAGTDADDAVTVPRARIAPTGKAYTLAVPVRAGSPSRLNGWIDFNRNGRFDAVERATAKVRASATTATLRWTVPQPLHTGVTWMRLRLATQGAVTASPTGWADSGEVEDHQIELARHCPCTN